MSGCAVKDTKAESSWSCPTCGIMESCGGSEKSRPAYYYCKSVESGGTECCRYKHQDVGDWWGCEKDYDWENILYCAVGAVTCAVACIGCAASGGNPALCWVCLECIVGDLGDSLKEACDEWCDYYECTKDTDDHHDFYGNKFEGWGGCDDCP